MNREEWLNKVSNEVLDSLFKRSGYTIPANIRYSTSFPSARAVGSKNKTIGQCWDCSASNDNTYEIFISPLIDDIQTVVGTLIHEIVHATVGLAAGHGKLFKQCALSVGLEGKMTATSLSNETFKQLEDDLKKIGNYPHAKLNASNVKKKQTTRMLKAVCPCGYGPIRISRKIVEEGLPLCPHCREGMGLVG